MDVIKLYVVTKKCVFSKHFTDRILEVARHKIYSLNLFFEYNQINVANEDWLPSVFIMVYGIYAYNKIPFGLFHPLLCSKE